MANDEEKTERILRAHRGVIDGIIDLHGGRIFNTGGDSVLAEFGSPVEAVRAAVEIQDALRTRNMSLSDEQQLPLRIGLNLGDVIVRGTDLLGDAVNVAARLQGITEPGGVLISQAVFDQIAGKLNISFAKAGERQLKNISRPISVYRLTTDSAARPAVESSVAGTRFSTHLAAPLLALAVVGATLIGAYSLYHGRQAAPDPDRTRSSQVSTTTSPENHWLNGSWVAVLAKSAVSEPNFCAAPEPRCRYFSIAGVPGDGTFGGIWGFPKDRGSAEVSVQGQNVKITTAVNSVVQVTQGADGLLRGNLVSRDGNEFMLTMRRVQ